MKKPTIGLDEVPMKYRLELDELNRKRAEANIEAMKKDTCFFVGSDDNLYVFPDFVQVCCFQCQKPLKIRPWLAELRDQHAPLSEILCPDCAGKRQPEAFKQAMQSHVESFKGVLDGARDEAIQVKTRENLSELSFALKNPQAFNRKPSAEVISKDCSKGVVMVSLGLIESIMWEPDSREFAEYVAYYEAGHSLILLIEESLDCPMYRELIAVLFGNLKIIKVFERVPMDKQRFNQWLEDNGGRIGEALMEVDKC